MSTDGDLAARLDEARARLQGEVRSPYITVGEAAALARCNPKTIRRAFQAGVLQAFRPAHQVLLREADVREWVESRPARLPGDRPRRSGARRRVLPGSVEDLRRIERELSS